MPHSVSFSPSLSPFLPLSLSLSLCPSLSVPLSLSLSLLSLSSSLHHNLCFGHLSLCPLHSIIVDPFSYYVLSIFPFPLSLSLSPSPSLVSRDVKCDWSCFLSLCVCSSVCVCAEHSNYFGTDDKLGPVAVSVRREKLDDTKDLKDQYQYRLIVRTSEVHTHTHTHTHPAMFV